MLKNLLLICAMFMASPIWAQEEIEGDLDDFAKGLVVDFYGVLDLETNLSLQGYGVDHLIKLGWTIDEASHDYFSLNSHKYNRGLQTFAPYIVGARWSGYVMLPTSDRYIVQVQQWQRNATCAAFVDFDGERIFALPEHQANLPTDTDPDRTKNSVKALQNGTLYPIEIRLNCVSVVEDQPITPILVHRQNDNGFRLHFSGTESGKHYTMGFGNTFHTPKN